MGIPQTSASERVEAARKALDFLRATIDGPHPANSGLDSYTLAHVSATLDGLEPALRALITPPSMQEGEEAIAERVLTGFPPAYDKGVGYSRGELVELGIAMIRAGIQSAHETWEPADRPSQEQMLRWLGLDYTIDGDVVVVHRKNIKREEI